MIALVPDDIFEACTDDELESVVSRTFGSPIQRRLRFGEDEEGISGSSMSLLIRKGGMLPPIF